MEWSVEGITHPPACDVLYATRMVQMGEEAAIEAQCGSGGAGKSWDDGMMG